MTACGTSSVQSGDVYSAVGKGRGGGEHHCDGIDADCEQDEAVKEWVLHKLLDGLRAQINVGLLLFLEVIVGPVDPHPPRRRATALRRSRSGRGYFQIVLWVSAMVLKVNTTKDLFDGIVRNACHSY